MTDQAGSGAHGERRRIGATRDGGVEAMGTREREEEYIRFMALSHLRAHGATRTSDGRAYTRDHVKKNFSQAARNSWADVERETVACRAFASGRQGPEGAPAQKPSADLVGLAMVRGGDHLDIVFNRNRLVVSVEGRDRDATLPFRRAPILGCTRNLPVHCAGRWNRRRFARIRGVSGAERRAFGVFAAVGYKTLNCRYSRQAQDMPVLSSSTARRSFQ